MASLDQTFEALADPTRRGIVVQLARGEATVSELVDQFDLSQPTISSHIEVLETAGIVSRSQDGQTRPCKLETRQLEVINDWLTQVHDVWEGNYKRLDSLLAELKQARKERRK